MSTDRDREAENLPHLLERLAKLGAIDGGANDGRRAEQRVITLSVATAVLYLATWLVVRSIARNGIIVPASVLDPPHQGSWTLLIIQMIAYGVLTIATFGAYWAVISMARSGALDHRRARLWAFLAPIALGLAFLAWVPRLSQDVLSYLAQGYLGLFPGDNPFLQPVEAARNSPIGPTLASFGWNTAPGITPYGIVWTQIEVAIAKLCAGDVLTAVLLFKAVALLASLGSALMIWIILGRMSPRLQLEGTLAYLWNPVLLVEFAGEGHNDAVMIFFALSALAACVTSRPTLSLLAQLCGAMTKYLNLLFLPAQLVYLWRTRRHGIGHLAQQLAIALVIAAALACVLYAPLWAGLQTFQGMVKRASPVSSAALFGSIDWVLRRSPLKTLSGPLTILSVTLPLLAFVAWSSLRVTSAADFARACAWTSLIYALVTSPDYWPWYCSMPLAFIIAGDFDRLFWLAILMSIVGCWVAPFELLHDHGFLSIQVSKGVITGLGSLVPLIALAVWSLHSGARLSIKAVLSPHQSAPADGASEDHGAHRDA